VPQSAHTLALSVNGYEHALSANTTFADVRVRRGAVPASSTSSSSGSAARPAADASLITTGSVILALVGLAGVLFMYYDACHAVSGECRRVAAVDSVTRAN
jgi:hypothetical protein